MARTPGTYAIINTTEGNIVCRLFDKDAPKTVQNFTDLAEGKREWKHPSTGKKSSERLYDGTIFHRVIPDLMTRVAIRKALAWAAPVISSRMKPKALRISSI